MKRWISIFLCVSLLYGCKGNGTMDEALALRSAILQAKECRFSVMITADYGDQLYSFSMDCIADTDGNVSFTLVKPETVADISGKLSAEGGKLIFDDMTFVIPMITDDQITPVSAPWILMRTLRGGYITSCTDGRITLDDSYADDALKLDITLDQQKYPSTAEVYWKNRRILTLEVTNFVLS